MIPLSVIPLPMPADRGQASAVSGPSPESGGAMAGDSCGNALRYPL